MSKKLERDKILRAQVQVGRQGKGHSERVQRTGKGADTPRSFLPLPGQEQDEKGLKWHRTVSMHLHDQDFERWYRSHHDQYFSE